MPNYVLNVWFEKNSFLIIIIKLIFLFSKFVKKVKIIKSFDCFIKASKMGNKIK